MDFLDRTVLARLLSRFNRMFLVIRHDSLSLLLARTKKGKRGEGNRVECPTTIEATLEPVYNPFILREFPFIANKTLALTDSWASNRIEHYTILSIIMGIRCVLSQAGAWAADFKCPHLIRSVVARPTF